MAKGLTLDQEVPGSRPGPAASYKDDVRQSSTGYALLFLARNFMPGGFGNKLPETPKTGSEWDELIPGDAGESCTFTVLRGKKTFDVTVTRAPRE